MTDEQWKQLLHALKDIANGINSFQVQLEGNRELDNREHVEIERQLGRIEAYVEPRTIDKIATEPAELFAQSAILSLVILTQLEKLRTIHEAMDWEGGSVARIECLRLELRQIYELTEREARNYAVRTKPDNSPLGEVDQPL